MTPFPVSSSILSTRELGYFLQEKYNLTKESSCQLMRAGINHTYLITDYSIKYVFRLYSLNWRTETQILEELRLINHLQQHHIPVSYAIPDENGKYIQELAAPEGNRMGVLFSYAAGEKLFNFLPETHFIIGEIMAKIHQNTLNFQLERIEYNPQTLLIDSFEELKQFISVETDEMVFMSSTQTYLLEELKKMKTENIRKGAVHIDIWFDNLHVNTNNQVTIFDFDFCGNGWLCLDIAYYLMQLYVVEADENEYLSKAQIFLQGYESVTQISNEEKQVLPMLGICLYFFYLGVQCQRFENFSNVFMSETYLKRYINLRIKKYFNFNNLNN